MSAGDQPVDEARLRELEIARRVAAGLLHEFRNVLNPIVSAAWLVEANANDPAKVIELARRIDGFAKADPRITAKLHELLEREGAGLPVQPPMADEDRSASTIPKA